MVDDEKPGGGRTVRMADAPTMPAKASDTAEPVTATVVDPAAQAAGLAGAAEALPSAIGRFEIHSLLGRGGMASVYRAFDPSLDRLVALKVLHAGGQDDDGARQRARTLREARAAAAIVHPNTVTVFEVGEEDGQAFIAMELVEGTTLRVAAQGDARIADRLRWLLEAARALFAAHQRGLVHRDVKPDNMIVDAAGHLRLLDYGIAKREQREDDVLDAHRGVRLDGPSSLRTVAGRQLGTPRYMAPEQRAGEATDPRTDQYAWGLVAVEILSGVLCEPGEDVTGRAGSLAVDPSIAAVVRRAVAPRMADRFPTFEPLIAAFEKASEASTTSSKSTPPKPPERTRRAGLAAIAGVLALLALGGFVVLPRILPARSARSNAAPSACRVASSSTFPGFAPSEVALLGDHRIVGAYGRLEAAGPDAGVVIVDPANPGAPPLEPINPAISTRADVVRTLVDGDGHPTLVALFPPRTDDFTTGFSLLYTWSGRPGGPSVRLDRLDIRENGMAVVPFRRGRLIALTYLFLGKDKGPRAEVRYGAGVVYDDDTMTPGRPDMVSLYDDTAVADRPALATSKRGSAMVYRRLGKPYVAFVDGELQGLGSAIGIPTTGPIGPPAIAYVDDRVVVAWAQRDAGGARLHGASLARGATAFEPEQLLVDELVTDDAPVFVPLAGGQSLLGWISPSLRGRTVRVARVGAELSLPLDVASFPEVTGLAAIASEHGASVAWIDRASRSVRSAEITCEPPAPSAR